MLWSGLGLNAAGAAAILALPLPAAARVFIAFAWALGGLREQARIRRHFRETGCFRIAATGSLFVGAGERPAAPAEVCRGTIALRRAIWLRYRRKDRRTAVELFLGGLRDDPQFRRAVVVLRMRPYRVNH